MKYSLKVPDADIWNFFNVKLHFSISYLETTSPGSFPFQLKFVGISVPGIRLKFDYIYCIGQRIHVLHAVFHRVARNFFEVTYTKFL